MTLAGALKFAQTVDFKEDLYKLSRVLKNTAVKNKCRGSLQYKSDAGADRGDQAGCRDCGNRSSTDRSTNSGNQRK